MITNILSGKIIAKSLNYNLGKCFTTEQVEAMSDNLHVMRFNKQPEITVVNKEQIIKSIIDSMSDRKKANMIRHIKVTPILNANDIPKMIKEACEHIMYMNEEMTAEYEKMVKEAGRTDVVEKPKLLDPIKVLTEKLEIPDEIVQYEERHTYLKSNGQDLKTATLQVYMPNKDIKKIVNHMGI